MSPLSFWFGVFPDAAAHPVAVFRSLEDAMEWGSGRFGPGHFVVRRAELVQMAEAAPATPPPDC